MNSLTLDTLFFILIALLFLSAFFSGSETALMSVNKYKLKHRVKKNEPSALRVDYLLKNTDRTLGLILLLNNFVNILASAIPKSGLNSWESPRACAFLITPQAWCRRELKSLPLANAFLKTV